MLSVAHQPTAPPPSKPRKAKSAAPALGAMVHEGFVVLSRKKHVPASFIPNTYRVISTVAEDAYGERAHSGGSNSSGGSGCGPRPLWEESDSTTNIIGQRDPGWYVEDKGHFKRHNVQNKFRAENSRPGDVENTQTLWWLQAKQAPKQAADGVGTWDIRDRVRDTTTRTTYGVGWRPGMNKCGRFTAYTYPEEGVRGVVPVTNLWEPDCKPRFWREKVSFQHIYDSRKNPNYPIAGKKHGAFVWDRLNYDNVVRRPVSSNPYVHR